MVKHLHLWTTEIPLSSGRFAGPMDRRPPPCSLWHNLTLAQAESALGRGPKER